MLNSTTKLRKMGFMSSSRLCRRDFFKSAILQHSRLFGVSSSSLFHGGKPVGGKQDCAVHSTLNGVIEENDKKNAKIGLAKSLACVVGDSSNLLSSTRSIMHDNVDMKNGKMKLAQNLACLIEESSKADDQKPKTRIELKRAFELRIKKRVKEQYVSGKFHNLMGKVIANPETLWDAYNCVRINSNVDPELNSKDIFLDSIAEDLLSVFDVKANTYTISTRGTNKEVFTLPNLKLKIVQEAIRIVLEVVYKPHFSRFSHGCRSGRGHTSALKYICKEISNPDWWFTLPVKKKLDICVLEKLISTMQDKIEDSSLYNMIRRMHDAQVLNLEFGGFPKGHGLPQEGVLSPILMNIYLDLFDREFYRMQMRYEALDPGHDIDQDGSQSKLRNWFRRQLKGNDTKQDIPKSRLRLYTCRFMDEIFFAISGSKDDALKFKTEVQKYMQSSLHLDVDDTEIIPCDGHHGIRFLGSLVTQKVREGPAVRAVHKLKEKVKLFASQKQEAWDTGTLRIGRKWLAHGLKKVKESEIRHLADSSSILRQISCYRKEGMKTDHWYKHLLKIWMQSINAKVAENEEVILSKYVAEPALPQELRDSYYEFQKLAEEFISSETAATLALLTNSSASESVTSAEVIAPVNTINKRLQRYGLTNAGGYPRASNMLILLDNEQIINWFIGLAYRWIRWYSASDNFNEIKLLICNQVRKSCIRTLAAKLRVHETEIEKQFESELSRIPSTEEIENEMGNELSALQPDCDEALQYGTFYSGLCLLSLARMVSRSRPCSCFVSGCQAAAPSVYTLHVMERQKFPGWKTGFSSCIHPSLNGRRMGLCKKHLADLHLGNISLQSIDFGAWK